MGKKRKKGRNDFAEERREVTKEGRRAGTGRRGSGVGGLQRDAGELKVSFDDGWELSATQFESFPWRIIRVIGLGK